MIQDLTLVPSRLTRGVHYVLGWQRNSDSKRRQKARPDPVASVAFALAKHLGRHYKNVHTDVARLTEIGLIEKTKDGKVSVPWDVIAAELKLAA